MSPLLYGAGAVLVAMGVGLGVQTWRLDSAQDALTTEQRDRAQERDQAKTVALEAVATFRKSEAAMADRIQEAQDAGRKETLRLERVAGVQRADIGRMRDELAAFAGAGGGAAADDSAAACRARAAELAEAVADGLRVQADMAGAFASLAVDYGTLYLSWPRSTP